MRTSVRWLVAFVFAAIPVTAQAGDKEAVARRMTAAIDKDLAADWLARNINPAPEADDAEFCRRVYLDLIGRIPRVAEVRAFLAEKSPDKRAKLVDRLMLSPSYAIHFAGATRADWLPQTLTDQRNGFFGFQFEDWLRKQYAANVPLDETIRKLLVAKVSVGQRGQVQFDPEGRNTDLFAIQNFYQANDAKPEQLAATVSRAFLGVKLECAQCHDHPFAPYSQEQFWEFAAFFGEFTPLPPVSPSFVGPLAPQYNLNRLTIPKGNKTTGTHVVTARYFDGSDPDWSAERTPRQELANWLTAKDNPYFARNLANRVWAHFFGVGIVEPIDEPGDENPPSHPELLAELGAGFAEAGYDIRVMVRAVTASRAYNLASKQNDASQSDPRRFARMHARGLTGNQIYDSFLAATGTADRAPRNQQFFDPRGDTAGRNAFRGLYGQVVYKPTETQTSILQALMMMNGQPIADQTHVGGSITLAAIIDAPFLDTEKKVDAVFLAALTREPSPEERERFSSYVERGGPIGDKKKALADVFWVLLNSTEFLFNH